MSRTPIPRAWQHYILERANNRCEYCLYPQSASFIVFEVEHIISEKHNGPTTLENLALACPYCNRYKGTDLGSLDSETGKLVPFFNLRTQLWAEHFRLDGAAIVPLSAEARVTIIIFQFNQTDRMNEREQLMRVNKYP